MVAMMIPRGLSPGNPFVTTRNYIAKSVGKIILRAQSEKPSYNRSKNILTDLISDSILIIFEKREKICKVRRKHYLL